MSGQQRSAVVLGARNLGGAVVDRLLGQGWRVAAVVRSDNTREAVARRGALALRGDAADPGQLGAALSKARDEHGGLDLVVNAVNATRPPEGSPFGGGPLADATLEDFRGWAIAVAEQAFVFLSQGIAALRESGGGTLLQVTGGSSRRAGAGRGSWAAGAGATRALVHAAAQELQGEPIRPILLVVDGVIGPERVGEQSRAEELAEIAETVARLADHSRYRLVHELVLSRSDTVWVP